MHMLRTICAAVVLATVGCGSNYPYEVCGCLEVDKANNLELVLVNKSTDEVILGPQVSVDSFIKNGAVLVFNEKSDAFVRETKGRGKWPESLKRKYDRFEVGYYLHQCNHDPELIPLGENREEAVRKAKELIREQDSQNPT